MDIFALLEEVDGLLAEIESTPSLPLAHHAPRQAALARQALETELVYFSNKSFDTPLKLLRAIAQTKQISVEAAKGDNDILQLMIDNGAIIDVESFIYACTNGHTEIVRRFIEKDITIDNRALPFASLNGHTDIVRLLLELPVERIVNGERALLNACHQGHTEIVRLFLVKVPTLRRRMIRLRLNDAFQLACTAGHLEIIRLFVELPLEEYGVSLNQAFQIACKTGQIEIVRLLLALPLNKTMYFNINYALQHACYDRQTDIVRMLLASPLNRGVNLDGIDIDAFRTIHTEIYTLLREKSFR